MAALTSRNGRNLQPIFSPLHLTAGTLVHKALQYWTQFPNKTLEEHCTRAAFEMQNKLKLRYVERVGAPPTDDEMLSTYEAVEAALAMCANYQQYYTQPLPDEYRALSKEQTIEIIIEGHILQGTVDTLVAHGDDSIGAVDHKTYNSRPRDDAIRHNEQFKLYAWLMREVGVAANPFILYDGLWRRLEPPRGKVLADLFKRQHIVYTDHELDEAGSLLPRLLNQMAAMYETYLEDVDRNRVWVGCWDCKVEPVCAAMSMGEDYQSVIESGYQLRDMLNEEDDA